MRLTLKLRKRSHSPYWYLEGQVNGQRFQESLRTKNRRHAQRLLELRYQELLAGTARTHKNLLATVVEQYLEGYAKVRKSIRSYEEDAAVLRRLQLCLGTPTSLQEITQADLDRYIAWRKQNVSNARVNREINSLKAFFTVTVQWGLLSGSPARHLQRLPEVKARRARYYTEEEIQTILDAVAATELEGPVLLALNLGLRAGEIVHLTVRDVDFKNHLVHVQAKPDWRPKDYEERSLEMNEEVNRFLVGWLSRPERTLSPYLFPGVRAQSKHGREANRLSVRFGRLLRRLGIRNGDFHTLRHTFASYHAMADTDLRALQLALGHASLRTTQRYAHLKPSHRTGITKRVRFGRLRGEPAVIPFPK